MPTFLNIVGNVFARVVLVRLQVLTERIYPESQCGFRSERSTVEMIFSIRQLQEKCREQQMPLYIAFIDLTKAFDLVSRQGLFQLLKKIGCPPQLHSIITPFMRTCSGVKQGCVLASTLFGISFSLLLNHAFKHSMEGIHLHTRSDDKLFNLARMRLRPKSAQSSSGSYFLLMMPHWPHTKRKSSNSLSASSLVPVRSLAWPSAPGRQKSWVRTFHRPPPSLLTTKCFHACHITPIPFTEIEERNYSVGP